MGTEGKSLDTQHSIGKLLEEEMPKDAIHIAVMCVTCEDDVLFPGERIGFIEEDNYTKVGVGGKPHLGVVDPFLTNNVTKGQMFWMFLFPNTITSLRHNWTHPLIKGVDEEKQKSSEMWLREWSSDHGIPFNHFLNDLNGDGERWITAQGVDLHSAPGAEFWQHVENYTGKRWSDEAKSLVGFSCSC